MIKSIKIANVATFGATPEVLNDLRQVNYIFGSNGTGKTTISRIIADESFSATCQCNWRNGMPLETLVLNSDFVDNNFSQLRGVFTLGEEHTDTLKNLDAAKEALDEENRSLARLKRTLEGEDENGGKKRELAQIEDYYRVMFWVPKQKYDKTLEGAFRGHMGSKQAFKVHVLKEAKSNTSMLKDLIDLQARAATIFGQVPTKEDAISALNTLSLLAHESNSILKKKVIGKDDVDIAARIKKLGNSDWVRQGLPYYKANDQVCPFCQQETSDAFAANLEEYFDETFEQDSSAIDTIIKDYATDATAIQTKIDNIVIAPGKYLDVENMKYQKALLEQRIRINQHKLEEKKKEPSQVFELEQLGEILTSIKTLIDAANAEVAKHNKMVNNLAAERKTLTAEVWRFVINELDNDIKQYDKEKETTDKAIAGLEKSIKETKTRIATKIKEIRDLEKQTTNIQSTINEINKILLQFGFDSFKLAMDDDGKHYKLIRPNGEDANLTLSEGERSFVVFLYFYHLLKGSMFETGMTTDRVVVFDDPVSSLDSDILFIVSSLIREVCENVRSGIGHIKQVFLLTHNVYFHKEVTYNRKRPSKETLKDKSFWIVRKCDQLSKLERYDRNPISTSYELLWMELRNPQSTNPTIENTLRRILEYYFKILGSIDFDDICAKFDDEDKLICKTLFSWVHAGSHSVFDDAYITPGDSMTQNSLRVFRSIFEKTNQIAHYEMMMGDAVDECNDKDLSNQTNQAM